MNTKFFKSSKQVKAGIATSLAGIIGFIASGVHFIKSKGALSREVMQQNPICRPGENQQISKECYRYALDLFAMVGKKLEPDYYLYYAASAILFLAGVAITVHGLCNMDFTGEQDNKVKRR